MENEIYSIGRKVEKIRKLKGIKQETLGKALGISPQAISKMEQSDYIDDERLQKIADALETNIETIKAFDIEASLQNIFNAQCTGFNFNCTFNPFDKIVELYDKLLESEREKLDLLKRIGSVEK